MIPRILGVGRLASGSYDSKELEASIRALVARQESESQHLEFKAAYPEKEKKDNDNFEFAKLVASIVNGGGGVIIYGIREGTGSLKDRATEIVPLPLTAKAKSLSEIVNTRIEPRLQTISFASVPIEDEAAGLLLVEIAPSARVPHALIDKVTGAVTYWKRAHTEKYPMAESEVERMYSERWEAARIATTTIDQLRTRVLKHSETLEFPRIWIAAVPLSSRLRILRPVHESKQALLEISARLMSLVDMTILGHDAKIRLGRIGLSSGWPPRGYPDNDWSEIGDLGEFLAVHPTFDASLNPDVGAELQRDGVQHYFSRYFLFTRTLGSLVALREIMKHFDITGDLLLKYGISGAWNHPLLSFECGFRREGRIEEDVEGSAYVSIDHLLLPAKLGLLARQFLEDLLMAFGLPGTFWITAEGSINAKAIDHRHKEDILRWCRAMMLRVE